MAAETIEQAQHKHIKQMNELKRERHILELEIKKYNEDIRQIIGFKSQNADKDSDSNFDGLVKSRKLSL